jgi:murein DD-endopeptidase MepM/ murein hydrolase activator NlpD
MSLVGNRRRKKSRQYEILVIPQGDGSGTKSIKAGGWKLVLAGWATFLSLFLIFLILFRFTPLGRLAGVDPAAQAALNNVESETERRIRSLADEVAVLKQYNLQLRKALGEREEKEPPSLGTETRSEEKVRQPESQGEPTVLDEFSSPVPAATRFVANAEGLRATFPLFVPVDGIITQEFEPDQKHFGIDYAAKQGAQVYAAAQGYVVFSGWTYDDGNLLILSHGGGYITVYKHNSSLLRSTGTLVRRGELICLVGSTGRTSKGPHLHFEVLKDGIPQDPQQFLLTTTKL